MLSYLPESIGELTDLSMLNVDRNRLSVLTNRIGLCRALRVLSVRENQLKEIPASIGDCQNLHVINVSGNLLDWLPDSLLKLDVKAVWLSENQAQPLIKFQHETLVGAGGPKRVLTCFLLPQRAPTEFKPPVEPEPTQEEMDSRQKGIGFAPEPEKLEVNDEQPDEEPAKDPFIRNDPVRVTPHPQDLKKQKEERAERAKQIHAELKNSRDNLGKQHIFVACLTY